jgi:transcriptional regulator GlxA family with amidase domain
MPAAAPATPVWLVATPGVLLLDLAGMAEPLRLANRFSGGKAFDLQIAGPAAAVQSSLPVQLAGLSGLPAQLGGSRDNPAWVVLSGATAQSDVPASQRNAAENATVDWLKTVVGPALAARTARLWTVCSGALLAARAGLLNGRQCTTHHELIEQLKKNHPSAEVQDNRIYVMDGPVATSAGVTSGVDLALAAIGERCGQAVASQVARDMVVYWRRAGGDPQLSPLLEHRNHLHPAVHRAQDAILADPTADWSVESMAAAAHVSSRHLRRLFQENAGLNPLAYVHSVRVGLAKQALAAGASVEEAASQAGFGSAQQMRRAWKGMEDSLPRTAKAAAKRS